MLNVLSIWFFSNVQMLPTNLNKKQKRNLRRNWKEHHRVNYENKLKLIYFNVYLPILETNSNMEFFAGNCY